MPFNCKGVEIILVTPKIYGLFTLKIKFAPNDKSLALISGLGKVTSSALSTNETGAILWSFLAGIFACLQKGIVNYHYFRDASNKFNLPFLFEAHFCLNLLLHKRIQIGVTFDVTGTCKTPRARRGHKNNGSHKLRIPMMLRCSMISKALTCPKKS